VEPSFDFPTGLFSFDTRFLSTWLLTLDGERLHALSVDDAHSYQTRFFLVPGEPTHYLDAKVSMIRTRSIGGNFTEELTVLNHSGRETRFDLRLEMGSDFADLFEIKHQQPKKGRTSAVAGDNALRLTYRREAFHREATITSSADARVDQAGMTWSITVAPHCEWSTRLTVTPIIHGARGEDVRAITALGAARGPSVIRDEQADLVARAPQLGCDCEPLAGAYRQSLHDLAALRYESITLGVRLLAAGLPWFMTLFGRDSMLTSLQVLPFLPELVPPTILMLAGLQGHRLDDFRDEEPGKILHELRYGETAGFEEQPHSPYYGAADSTPLFVILLDEYERWSGDAALVRQLRHPARMALDWIDGYGDLTGDGYLRYQRRNTRNGLVNQGWRNSPDAIVHADGRAPAGPRATCELQGYAYDAKRRGARLAREFWGEPEYADLLERQAAALRERFNRDFWLPRQEHYASALEPDGTPVAALTSQLGHLLWSGIVAEERSAALAAHLVGPQLFSGFGVRTFADGQLAYNPVGAHLGAVWPSDNALVAAGLRRYHHDEEAARVADGIFAMADLVGGSVPEVIAGYPRAVTGYPVQLPMAGRPQSWSAGALLMLLGTLLGLRPCGDNLLVNPALPDGFGRIELLDVPGRWGRADAYGRDRSAVRPGHRPRLR
ncbi:glycogen debranching N-terminal domain-containing protein, partial [Streptomyces sp. NPDC052644]